MIPIRPYGPVPDRRQLAWFRRGKTAFLHFSMNTFTGKEWGGRQGEPRTVCPRGTGLPAVGENSPGRGLFCRHSYGQAS